MENTLKEPLWKGKGVVTEGRYGRVADAKGAKGRYVRLYSNGSTADEMNRLDRSRSLREIIFGSVAYLEI